MFCDSPLFCCFLLKYTRFIFIEYNYINSIGYVLGLRILLLLAELAMHFYCQLIFKCLVIDEIKQKNFIIRCILSTIPHELSENVMQTKKIEMKSTDRVESFL